MTINEIAKELNMTKRAIKYYEEQGLLKVSKDSNGYRNYSKQDLETLRAVSIYRKLGISISDIKKLLEKENKDIYMVALRDDDGNLIGYYEKHEYRNKETNQLYDFDNEINNQNRAMIIEEKILERKYIMHTHTVQENEEVMKMQID